jgi:hypothetical protein
MGKIFSFLSARPSNLVTNHLTNVEGNENCIIMYCIMYCKFAPISHESIIHDYIVMFHV